MTPETIRIKRYPNRRFYASHTSRYVALPEIEEMICGGATVEIVDSQTGEDLTRTVLMQILAEKHPDKVALFPASLLHSILRANDVMTAALSDYFRSTFAYLEYFQKHGASTSFQQPMHWMKAWLDNWPTSVIANRAPNAPDEGLPSDERVIAEKIRHLEARIAELETKAAHQDQSPNVLTGAHRIDA